MLRLFAALLILLALMPSRPAFADDRAIRAILGIGAGILRNELDRNRPRPLYRVSPRGREAPRPLHRVAPGTRRAPAVPDADGLSGSEVLAYQKALNTLGFDVGKPDGRLGPATGRAIATFLTSRGLDPDTTKRREAYAMVIAAAAASQAAREELQVASGADGASEASNEDGDSLETGEVLAYQKALNTLGFNVGEPDGKLGPATGRAIAAFVASRGHDPDTTKRREAFAMALAAANGGAQEANAFAARAKAPDDAEKGEGVPASAPLRVATSDRKPAKVTDHAEPPAIVAPPGVFPLVLASAGDRPIAALKRLADEARSRGERPLSEREITQMQAVLNALGLDAGTPDGRIGPRTRDAMVNVLSRRGGGVVPNDRTLYAMALTDLAESGIPFDLAEALDGKTFALPKPVVPTEREIRDLIARTKAAYQGHDIRTQTDEKAVTELSRRYLSLPERQLYPEMSMNAISAGNHVENEDWYLQAPGWFLQESSIKLSVSPEYIQILNKSNNLTFEQSKKIEFESNFLNIAKAISEQYGPSHPAVGVVLSDLAALQRRWLSMGDNSDPGLLARSRDNTRKAAQILLGSRVGDKTLQNALVRVGVSTLLAAEFDPYREQTISSHCANQPDAEEFGRSLIRAAAHYYDQFGVSPLPIVWLGQARLCLQDRAERLELAELARALALQLKSTLAIARSSFDLGYELELSGQRERAKVIIRQGFSALSRDDSAASGDFLALYDPQSAGKIRVLGDLLKGLGLTDEAKYYAAVIAEGVVGVDLSMTAAMGVGSRVTASLEAAGQYEFNDIFYAYLAGPNRHRGHVDWIIGSAGEWIDGEDYADATAILHRILGQIDSTPPNRTKIIILAQLARAYDEMSDFETALRYTQLGIAEANALQMTDFWALDDLKKIAQRALKESGDTKAFVVQLAADVDEALRSVCSRNEHPTLFPVLPIVDLREDVLVENAFLQSAVVENYLECYQKLQRNLPGIVAPWGRELGPEAVRNAFYLAAQANDQETASAMLRTLAERNIWYAFKNDADLNALLPEQSFRYVEATRRLDVARESGLRSLVSVYVAAFQGLVMGGKVNWLDPYRVSFREQLISALPIMEISEQAEEYLWLNAAGFGDIAERLYRKSATDPASMSSQSACRSTEECELKWIEALFPDWPSASLDDRLGRLSASFVVMNSGASQSVDELDQIVKSAVEEGVMMEAAGFNRLAAMYFDTAREHQTTGSLETAATSSSQIDIFSLENLRTLAGIARSAVRRGDDESAHRVVSTVVRTARDRLVGSTVLGGDALIRWRYRLRPFFEMYLDTLVQADDAGLRVDDVSLFVLQYLQFTRPAMTVAKLGIRMRSEAGEALREFEANSERVNSMRKRLFSSSGDDASELLSDLQELETKNADLQKAILRENPEISEGNAFRFLDLEEAQSSVQSGETVLVAYAGDANAYVLAFNSVSSALRRVSASSEIESLSAALRGQIDAYLSYADPKREWDLGVYHALFERIVSPFQAQLVGSKRILYVSGGAFDEIPLGTLLPSDETSPLTFAQMRAKHLPWLIRQYAVSVLPALSSMEILGARANATTDELSFLGVGNPNFEAGISRERGVLSGPGRDRIRVPPLPETEMEVRQISQSFGRDALTSVFVGDQASESTLRTRDLTAFRVIAFATHAVLADQIPGLTEPALILSLPDVAGGPDNDGLLTSTEISSLRLDADLIILSACNTAANDGQPGAAGLSGLANAFFWAGARGLVATHWPIPSEPAVLMSTGMISAASATQYHDWASALQASTIAVIDEKGPPKFTHPAAWGAHIAVGRFSQ